MNENGVGASSLRKEDDRHLRGRGKFVGDIQPAGTRHIAFLRSPVAHGYLRSVSIPTAYRDQVFVASDLQAVTPIRAGSSLPGFKPSDQPVLVHDKIRHVGELIAMCIGKSRADAEDLVDELEFEFEELPAIVDMLKARKRNSPLVHDEWIDNVYLESSWQGDAFDKKDVTATVTREFRTNRQCMAPIEGRGVIAYRDNRLDQLVIYSSTQMPHIVRTGLAECLGLDHARIRVISPDVGGGFGYKGILADRKSVV